MRDPDFSNFCRYLAKGEENAAAFLIAITEVAHFFDDLHDGDVPLKRESIQTALWASMVALPRNEFYRKYFIELQPLVTNAIVNWRVANALEEAPSGETDLRVAFVVRSSYADLLQQTALLCGGPEWATQVGIEVRRRCHSESWKDYLRSVEASHGHVQRAEAAGPQSGDDRVSGSERADRAATDRPWPRAVRLGEAERGTGPPDAGPDSGATDATGG